MIKIKLNGGVDMNGIRPELVLVLTICDQIFEDNGVYETIITSLKDGTHKPGSWHYSGWAADLRSKHLASAELKKIILDKLRNSLGPQWEIILESPGKNNEHFHIEPSPAMKAEK